METRSLKLAAIMTAPRFELTYSRNWIERALKAANIPLSVSGGVFYGQCMQKMLVQLIEAECDYAITVDFDSLFTGAQVIKLVREIETRPEIDAITGLQVRRGKLTMLGTVAGGQVNDNGTKTVEVKDEPILAETAHFGLTVIDLKKLAAVPKPWFCAVPDANGDWENDKVDDDVYFWKKWAAAGNTIYMDPTVRLGHVEEMVVIHDDELKPKHIYPGEWEEWSSKS